MKIYGSDIEKMKDTLFAVKAKTQLNIAYGLHTDTDSAKEDCETFDFCIALLNKITLENLNKTLHDILFDIVKEKYKSAFRVNNAHWIYKPASCSFKCSHCDKCNISETDYCPHCGSKMDKTE